MSAVLLDTSVAIPLRDGDPDVFRQVSSLKIAPYLSILSVVELEGGVYSKPQFLAKRRSALDAMLPRFDILPFDRVELDAYREILKNCGFARAKILDRLIAATALAHGLALATRNAKDVDDIPRLVIEQW